MASPVIDVHTHSLTEAWFQLLQRHGAPRYSVQPVAGGMRAIHLDGAPFMTPVPAMFDYDLRVRTMNDVGVDIGIVSLTCPNCYWGGPEVSLGRRAHHERRHGGGAHRASRPAPVVRFAAVAVPRARTAGARARGRGRRVGRDGARQRRRPPAHRSGVRADLERDRLAVAARARASDCAAGRARHGHGPLPADRVDRIHVRHHRSPSRG